MPRDQQVQLMVRVKEEILRATEDQHNNLLLGPLKGNI
jgi:hypothetical protein